jgi:hypothetical protein
MLTVNFLILAFGVLAILLACFAVFIEEAFSPCVSKVRQETTKTAEVHDLLSVKTRQRTMRRNQSVPRRWALHRQVSIRHFSR